MRLLPLLLVLLAVLMTPTSLLATSADPSRRASEVAKPRRIPDGAPRSSDVIMRSLTLRVAKGKNRHDTFQALSDFHVTRLEWTYIRDQGFITKVRSSGRLFGGAASSALSHISRPSGEVDYTKLACLDLSGTPVIPTWKRTWRPPGNLWMCANNPMVERYYVDYLKSCLEAGAQIMQRDEPGGNANAVSWGGCFCDHCVRAFREYLAKNTTSVQQKQLGIDDIEAFDYRQLLREQQAPVGDDFRRWNGGGLKELFERFQEEATVAFHRRTRQALNDYAGRGVPVSCNNGCRRWTDIELTFDWCFGELSYRHTTPAFIHGAMMEAMKRDRCQVITMPKKHDREDLDAWCRLTRQTIAMAYACGGHCMVPWDVYMPADAPRYFGTPAQYADLFAFIRASRDYLDGYEYAGAVGPGIECPLCAGDPPVRTPAGSQLCAIVRAIPGRTDGAVAVHLVDWSAEPKPQRLVLNPQAFFGSKALKMRLLTPRVYEPSGHEKAARTGDYGSLAQTTPLEDGYITCVSLPVLKPWGILIIEPQANSPAGVWQPAIWSKSSSHYRERLAVQMASASPEATVYYTTNGSTPTKASTRYAGPVELTRSAIVKAVALLADGRASRVASAPFQKRSEGPPVTMPDSNSLRSSLVLWLKADALKHQDGTPVTTWVASAGPNALAKPRKAVNGTLTQPPMLKTNAIHGQPAIHFDGVDDSMAIAGFANKHLAGKAFTVFMVTQAETDRFGMCGNGISGSGGDPRLYLQRGSFHYDVLNKAAALHPGDPGPAISVFMHDGDKTISAASNGALDSSVSGLPVVQEFGSGGNLAVPFWSGNQNCPGDVGEIIVFDRKLADGERAGVEAYLADKYSVNCFRRWE